MMSFTSRPGRFPVGLPLGLLAALGLIEWSLRGGYGLFPGWLGPVGAGGAALFGLAGRRWQRSPCKQGWGEELRLGLLPLLAVACYRPFLHPGFFGGTDAQSYVNGLADTLQQARSGVFPVLVGQTEFMFQGVIHPLRTAPWLHHLGLLLDLITLHRLEAVAILHACVLVNAIFLSLVAYACLVRLEGRTRWAAWGFAVVYVSAPVTAGFVYAQEMYMTFLAMAWLPVVIFANLRVARQEGTGDWIRLSAALVVVWFCHAPVGLWATLSTGLFQVLRMGPRMPPEMPRRAGMAAAAFAVLGAGYFWAVLEASQSTEEMAPQAGLSPVVVLALGLACVVRYLGGGSFGWALGAGTGAVVGGWLEPRPGIALGVALVVGMSWSWLSRWRPGLGKCSSPVRILAVLVAGALAGWLATGGGPVVAHALLRPMFPQNLLPVSSAANLPGDLQLGYPLLVAILGGGWWLLRSPQREGQVLGSLAILGLLLVYPVPGLTPALLETVPRFVRELSSASLWQRYLPLVAATGMFAGYLAFAGAWARSGPLRRAMLGFVLATACTWSLAQAERFVHRGQAAIADSARFPGAERPENVRQYAYIFAGMPASPYLVNGVMDHHLESRLLRLTEPAEELEPIVPATVGPWQVVRAEPDPTDPRWLNLAPGFELAPGERRLLHFRFSTGTYAGVLVLSGPAGWYREYQLPSAGFGLKSFGVAPGRPKSIEVWNAGIESLPVTWRFLQHEPGTSTAGAVFAEVAMQRVELDHLKVRTHGLVPFRAEVDASEDAWLESPRRYLPGYVAEVDGRATGVAESPNHHVMVRVPAGRSSVEIRYRGTVGLHVAWCLSLIAWAAFAFLGLRREAGPEPS